MITDKNNWIDSCAKDAPCEFIRESAARLQKNGYLSLGEVFDLMSDLELKVLLHALSKEQDSKAIIRMLITLVSIGEGIYTTDLDDLERYIRNLLTYIELECMYREFISDKELRGKRKMYSIETSGTKG